MRYYKVVLKGVPVLRFAHAHEASRYGIVFPKIKDFIEITFVEQGEINVWKAKQLINTCPEQALSINYGKEECRVSCEAPMHKHITVGLSIEYEMLPISEEQVIDYSREKHLEQDSQKLFAILPAESGLILAKNQAIPTLLREIAHRYPDTSIEGRLSMTAQVIKLFSEITQECVRQSLHTLVSPANVKYAEKAMRYISENIHRKITIEEIAGEVNLSPTHIGNVFKMVTGQTIIEYINQIKMQVVKEMVLNGHLSFAEAGERVGITDTSYLSRLFRKHMKVSIQQLKREQN